MPIDFWKNIFTRLITDSLLFIFSFQEPLDSNQDRKVVRYQKDLQVSETVLFLHEMCVTYTYIPIYIIFKPKKKPRMYINLVFFDALFVH